MNSIVDFLNGIGGLVGIGVGILLGMLVIGGLVQGTTSAKEWLEESHPVVHLLLTAWLGLATIVGGGWCFIHYIV